MSIQTMESPATMIVEPRVAPRPSGRQVVVIFLPAVLAALALLLHRVLPDLQTPMPSSGRYSGFLKLILALTSILAFAAFALPRLGQWIRPRAPLVSLALVVLCVWDLVTLKFDWMPLPYFPGPDMVFRGLADEWRPLLINASQSLVLLSTGYAVGTILGLFSGVSMGWSSRVRYWGMPVLKLIGPIPATALIPLAMAVFSSSFFSGAALIALAVWFPVTMLTASGISNVRVAYLDVARTLGAGRLYLIFRVAVPAATPSIFIGLFMGLGAAFLTLIAAETVGVSAGLGYYVRWRQAYCEYDKVYAALIVMAVFFSGVMTLLFKFRDRLLVWQKGVIRW
jgi:NitT/TauT family transport system permease protein